MESTPEVTVEEMREESERARDALAATVEELRDRVGDSAMELKTLVSPAHIKNEIRNFVSDESKSFVRSIRRRAKDDPLQVAAVGAAIAYPAWSLLRAIPTPLLLIGAGLFLTSKRGQESARDIQAKVEDVVQLGTEKAVDFVDTVRSDLEDRAAGARYGAEELRDTVISAAGAVTDKARAMFQDAAATAQREMISAKGAIDGAAGKVSSVSEGIGEGEGESIGAAKDQAFAAVVRSRAALTNFVSANPLLVAGLGAAVGAFIAASIPSSNAENKLFGAGSEKLKGKAREAAAQGIETAGDIAATAAGSVAAAAAREGLDAAGIQRTLNTVAESVRKVADHGMETALGANSQSGQQQPNTQRNAT